MSLYWIIVAVLNLLLGLAAGRYLGHWFEPQGGMPRFPRRKAGAARGTAASAAEQAPAEPVPEADAKQETPPESPPEASPVPEAVAETGAEEENADSPQNALPEVVQQFQGVSSPEELVLCAADVLQCHCRSYLQELARIDSLARELQRQFQPEEYQQALGRLEQLSDRWLAVQRTALEQMTAHAAAGQAPQIERLEHLLLEQTAQIETAVNNLRMAPAEETEEAAARLLREVKALVQRMHHLQEQTLCVAAEVFDPQQNADTEEPLRQDEFIGLPSRLGIATLVERWRIDDPHRMRQASVILVGVDQMGQWNEQLGVEVGDWLLKCLAQAFPQAVRQNRGFDRVGYYGGDRFLIFLGDASPHNASVVAERMRQSAEEGQFTGPQGPVPLRISCGVVECLPGDSFQSTCARAEQTLQHAKQNGRNCTAVHDGTQVSVIQAPPLKIVAWSFEFSQDRQPVSA